MDDVPIQNPLSNEEFINPAVQIKEQSGAAVAVINGGEIFISDERGIKPLLRWLKEDEDFYAGAFVADKIIGRAAAHILLSGGAAAVHGCVMSRGAYEMLTEAGCICTYDILTEMIMNRQGDGMCPMEMTVSEVTDSAEAVRLLMEKVNMTADMVVE